MLGYSVLYIAALPGIPGFLALLIEAYFLKATFAINCLLSPAREIYKHLEENRLEKVRELLPIYVSRNTSKLTKNQMSSAVVESVSENYVDGILSPIFYYAVFGEYGLVAAYAFKAISTLDSMVGYKTEPYKELGYFSAKSDDVLNWIPARISVIFILAAAFTVSLFPKRKKNQSFDSVKTALKDGMKTLPIPVIPWLQPPEPWESNLKTQHLCSGSLVPTHRDKRYKTGVPINSNCFRLLTRRFCGSDPDGGHLSSPLKNRFTPDHLFLINKRKSSITLLKPVNSTLYAGRY